MNDGIQKTEAEEMKRLFSKENLAAIIAEAPEKEPTWPQVLIQIQYVNEDQSLGRKYGLCGDNEVDILISLLKDAIFRERNKDELKWPENEIVL